MTFNNLDLIGKIERKPLDASGRRRQRLYAQLNKQIEFASTFSPLRKQRGRWFQQEPDGSFILAIRYARRDLELAKGKFGIRCESTEKLVEALQSARLQCSKGFFDGQLEEVSQQVKAGFRKK